MPACETFELPLLHDHHSHPLLYASIAAGISLESVAEKSAAVQLIKDQQAQQSSGLTLVHGWRSNLFQWSAEDLQQFAPLAIFNLSLHSLLLNPGGAELLRERYGADVDKVSDQVWYENHFRQVLNWFANLNATPAALQTFFAGLEQLGVYSAEELLLVDEHEIDLFRQANLLQRTKFWAAPDTFDTLSATAQQQVAGIKLFADGALGARTAALSEPYRGQPSNRGMLVYTDQQLLTIVEKSLEQTDALAVHAIGDVAIQQIVSALEKCQPSVRASEVRIEHAQLIDLETAGRCKSMGIKLSMQPNFSDDSIHYRDRLNDRFCQMNNPFRMLIDDAGFVPGYDLIFGSDGMPHGIGAAAQQCLISGLPSQRLSVSELAAAFGGVDPSRGTIELTVGEAVNFKVRLP